jgi:endonuclease/exonuclease/phosphatase family metal-dependent hydrolase
VLVRALTMNIQNTEGDPRRIGLINAVLRSLAPDVVSLQEVVRTAERDQLAELLTGTGLHGIHQSDLLPYDPPWSDRYGGNALATRWPHKLVEVLDLRSALAPDVPWCTLAASVAVPECGELLFIAATTSWRLEAEAARERQVLALTDLDSRHRRELPTIIAGDLNASSDAASIRYLTGLQSLDGQSVHYYDAWSVAGEGPGHTWTAENPTARAEIDEIVRQPNHRRRLDYILVGSWHAHPKARCRVKRVSLALDQPVDGIWPSDHFGVVADLDITRESEAR